MSGAQVTEAIEVTITPITPNNPNNPNNLWLITRQVEVREGSLPSLSRNPRQSWIYEAGEGLIPTVFLKQALLGFVIPPIEPGEVSGCISLLSLSLSLSLLSRALSSSATVS